MEKAGINHEAWARTAITFIRERGLEMEFADWCGGWRCPIETRAQERCVHEWIDIRNKIVENGAMCRKCGKIRAENV